MAATQSTSRADFICEWRVSSSISRSSFPLDQGFLLGDGIFDVVFLEENF